MVRKAKEKQKIDEEQVVGLTYWLWVARVLHAEKESAHMSDRERFSLPSITIRAQ